MTLEALRSRRRACSNERAQQRRVALERLMRMILAAVLLSSLAPAALAQGFDPEQQLADDPKVRLELMREAASPRTAR
jgi:hypothetical protein